MANDFLIRIFEHNNWANLEIVKSCLMLNDEHLDARPQSVTRGSIRETLVHLVGSQAWYLSLLTLPVDERTDEPLQLADLAESVRSSGEGLLALARGERQPFSSKLQTDDGYHVDSWVIMVQLINHATEHREQIKSMLSALGATPPSIDGWDFGEANSALVKIPDGI